MSASSAILIAQLNGRAATAEELAPLAFAEFAHFTAMQVRGGQVRGLDLHLERLRSASVELFGQAQPENRIRSYLRKALKASPTDDLSLTATIYLPANGRTSAAAEVEPDILVRTGPPASGPKGPLALATVEYERVLPAVKHVGEVAKTHFLRRAVKQGFDDVAFVDRRGRLSEASIWNLAFWDGDAVIWPMAQMLAGTTMGIVRRQLDRLNVSQRVREITLTDISTFAGAVIMNSWTAGVAVQRIDTSTLPHAPVFLDLLHQAYRQEPVLSP